MKRYETGRKKPRQIKKSMKRYKLLTKERVKEKREKKGRKIEKTEKTEEKKKKQRE